MSIKANTDYTNQTDVRRAPGRRFFLFWNKSSTLKDVDENCPTNKAIVFLAMRLLFANVSGILLSV